MPYAYKRKRRRFTGKRTKKFRKTARSRPRIPRSLVKNDFFMTKFELNDTQQTIWTLVSGGIGSLNQQSMVFNASQFKGFGDLSRHFESYKINLFVVKWVSVQATMRNVEISDTTNPTFNTATPNVMCLVDRNDDQLFTGTATEIIDKYRAIRRTKIWPATQGRTFKIKPSTLIPVYKVGGSTGGPDDWAYNSKYNTWVHLNQAASSLDVSFFGMKIAMEDGAQGQYMLRPEITAYVTFKKRKGV